MNQATVIVHCPPCFHCGQRAEVQVLAADWEKYKAGAHAQQAFPEMPPAQREMLISGTHPACWDILFADDNNQ